MWLRQLFCKHELKVEETEIENERIVFLNNTHKYLFALNPENYIKETVTNISVYQHCSKCGWHETHLKFKV